MDGPTPDPDRHTDRLIALWTVRRLTRYTVIPQTAGVVREGGGGQFIVKVLHLRVEDGKALANLGPHVLVEFLAAHGREELLLGHVRLAARDLEEVLLRRVGTRRAHALSEFRSVEGGGRGGARERESEREREVEGQRWSTVVNGR